MAGPNKDDSLSAEQASERIDNYAARCLEVLTQVADLGYFSTKARVNGLNGRDFVEIQSRPGFREFLAVVSGGQ